MLRIQYQTSKFDGTEADVDGAQFLQLTMIDPAGHVIACGCRVVKADKAHSGKVDLGETQVSPSSLFIICREDAMVALSTCN
jgi:hypothetical protein